MPTIFLSPSTQEFNPYIDGGNEEYYMNLIADAMEPYLIASGINFVRNDPEKTVSGSIAQSNAGSYQFHLAIHSNASPAESAGQNRGTLIFFYPDSAKSKRAAEIFAENFKKIYPEPQLVRTVPTTTLAEIVRTAAPTILIEVAYHDNRQDARWIRENIGIIAENLSMSTAEFLGVPFRQPDSIRTGIVTTQSTALNLRQRPSTDSAIIAKIPRGAKIPIIESDGEWYLTRFNGIQGFVFSRYVKIN